MQLPCRCEEEAKLYSTIYNVLLFLLPFDAWVSIPVLSHLNELLHLSCQVHVPSSCMLDGVHSQHFFGTGLIIFHSKTMGLIVVDKNTAAVSVSDVMLSFAAYPIEIPGEVIFYQFLMYCVDK